MVTNDLEVGAILEGFGIERHVFGDVVCSAWREERLLNAWVVAGMKVDDTLVDAFVLQEG